MLLASFAIPRANPIPTAVSIGTPLYRSTGNTSDSLFQCFLRRPVRVAVTNPTTTSLLSATPPVTFAICVEQGPPFRPRPSEGAWHKVPVEVQVVKVCRGAAAKIEILLQVLQSSPLLEVLLVCRCSSSCFIKLKPLLLLCMPVHLATSYKFSAIAASCCPLQTNTLSAMLSRD